MTDLWNAMMARLEEKLDRKELKTWFEPTKQLSFLEGPGSPVLAVSVPSRVFADWIASRHGALLSEAAAALGFPGLAIRYEPVSAPAAPAAPPPAATTVVSRGLVLNPRFTFDSFVVGSSNQFAHAAARAVGESPSHAYNPLFLYGGVGLGKTHLMHAIAHEILRRSPDRKVLYLSAERFLNELINALRFERMHEFKQRYRELDVLLMDDVQFIAGKDSTQEEFFYTFNALHDAQKQIVLTSDALPKEIPTLEERLRSRFEWGLIADIQPPNLEMKVAILRKKAAAEKIEIPNDVALFIAGSVRSNVRELEGRFESRPGLLLVERRARLRRAGPLHVEGHPRHRRKPGRSFGDPEARRGALRPARLGHEGQVKRQADRFPSPGRDVSLPQTDRPLLPRDRPSLQRQAPFDRHAFRREDRAPGRRRPEFPQSGRVVSAALPLTPAAAPRFFLRPLFHTRAGAAIRTLAEEKFSASLFRGSLFRARFSGLFFSLTTSQQTYDGYQV